jgi:predicted nucleotidyltransferase
MDSPKPPVLSQFPCWMELLQERTGEAVNALQSIPGVRGLILGGSIGRGQPWPISDIDILPIIEPECGTEEEVENQRAALVEWWSYSVRPQSLDVGRLRFSPKEAVEVTVAGLSSGPEKMADQRWFHGVDKAYNGKIVADHDGLAHSLLDWINTVRFDEATVRARIDQLWMRVDSARQRLTKAMAENDRDSATLALRATAGPLSTILLESWGTRIGSMSRSSTLFERIADAQDASSIADRLAFLNGTRKEDALQKMKSAPLWLRERVNITFAARQEVGENVTKDENARDQIAAFAILVTRRRPKPWGDWVGVPDPLLEDKLEELDEVISLVQERTRN